MMPGGFQHSLEYGWPKAQEGSWESSLEHGGLAEGRCYLITSGMELCLYDLWPNWRPE